MKALWNVINNLEIPNVKTENTLKPILFLGGLVAANVVIGAALWILIGHFFLPGIDWLICFMGYPAIFVGMFGGILYLYNHAFS